MQRLWKGKTLEVIADELEETVENIRELYEELLKEKKEEKYMNLVHLGI